MSSFATTKEMKEVIAVLGKPLFAGVLKENPCSLQQIALNKCKLPCATISDKAEQLFLYGRDIFISAVLGGKKSGVVVVRNRRGEPLGIGRFEKGILVNVKDLGFYLRSEDSCQISKENLLLDEIPRKRAD